MSLTFAAAAYFNDTPIKPSLRPRNSAPEIRPPKDSKPPARKRSKTLLSQEAERLLDIELDSLENHVPSSTPSIIENFEPSRGSRSFVYPKLNDANFSLEMPKKKRNFSPWNAYEYNPLPENSIRLLCFKPSPVYAPTRVTFELVDVSLDDHPPYEALSYRWSSLLASQKVLCEGRVLLVSTNCKKALKRLNVENRLLWVDAICIHQQNDDERSNQVSLMSKIYSEAERTIAWLGEDEDLGASCLADIDSAVPYLKLTSDTTAWPTKDMPMSSVMNKNSIITLLRDDALGPSLAFSKLLRRSWFRRIWILQEVALAKDIWIYCGSQKTTWSAFSGVLKALKAKSKTSGAYRAAWNLATFRHLYQQNKEQGGIDVHVALVQSRGCEATDPRDKVYALLGVCPELARLVEKPDYDLPVNIIWTRAQRACLASTLSINALSLVSVGERSRKDLPSWVPDLSDGLRTWLRRPPSASPTDGIARILHCSRTNGYCLHAWGTFVDSIVQTCGHTKTKSLEDMSQGWSSWWTQLSTWEKIHNEKIPDRIFAFWSTLYCDVNRTVPRTSVLQSWHSCVIDHEENFGVLSEETEAFPGVRALDYIESTSNRLLGLTKEGSIGLFASNAQVGDRVVLFAGGTIPYLVRLTSQNPGLYYQQRGTCFRRSGDAYQLIGPCYVYGLTDWTERARDLLNYQEILLF